MIFFDELDKLYSARPTILGIESWKRILEANNAAELISACRAIMLTPQWLVLQRSGEDFIFPLMRELKVTPDEAYTRFRGTLSNYGKH